MSLIADLDREVETATCEIEQRARGDERVRVLTQIRGVGRYTAMLGIAEAGDVSRFPNAHKLCAWAGLTPTSRWSRWLAPRGRRPRPKRGCAGQTRRGLGCPASAARRFAADREQRGAALGAVALPAGTTVGQGHLPRVGDVDPFAADAPGLRPGCLCFSVPRAPLTHARQAYSRLASRARSSQLGGSLQHG
jgi:Transposase IS116/IS110/IS902 family